MGLGISGLLGSLAGILYTLFSLLAVRFYLLVREILYVALTDGYKLKASQPGVKITATLAILPNRVTTPKDWVVFKLQTPLWKIVVTGLLFFLIHAIA